VLLKKDTSKYGSTPLLLAATKGTTDVFHYLTEIGADINIPNAYRNTAPHNTYY
jgi:ankyrin repeat protein